MAPARFSALLCCLTLLAAMGQAAAQESRQPRVDGVSVVGCLDYGARIVVRGSGFGRAGGRALVLRDPDASVELPVARWTDRSISATVPKSRRLVRGKWYELGILDKASGGWISAQRRPLQICPPQPSSSGSTGSSSTGRDATGSSRITAQPPDRDDPRDPKPDPRRPEPGTQPQPEPTPPRAAPEAPAPPPAPPVPPAPPATAAADDQRVPDEVLAVTPTLAAATTLSQQVTNLGYSVRALQELPGLGFALLRLGIPGGQDVPTALTNLRQAFPAILFDANALYEPDAAARAAAAPRLYAKSLIGWTAPAEGCAAAPRIGLIDTAVDVSHPAFAGRDIAPRSFLAAGVPPAPPDHGTAVAALLVGAPQTDSAGLLPAARLFAAAIFSVKEDGRTVGSVDAIARALDWLSQEGVRVVNLSLSGPGNQVMELTAARAAAGGLLLVAAAGNNGPNARPVFPAGYPQVMAVTAVDAALQPYAVANRGDYIDLAAPGVDVWSARGGQGGRYNSGTSFAAPFVAAAAALLLHVSPDAAPNSLRQHLRQGARDLGTPGRDSTFGWGLLQPPAC